MVEKPGLLRLAGLAVVAMVTVVAPLLLRYRPFPGNVRHRGNTGDEAPEQDAVYRRYNRSRQIGSVSLTPTVTVAADTGRVVPQYDTSGYVFYCPCMGNIGNQIDQLLWTLAFAKELNRTLVVPPITYNNNRFTDWFKLEPLLDYHRAIPAEDFMQYIAPDHWPPGERIGFCQSHPYRKRVCDMRSRGRHLSFWEHVGVDFDDYRFFPKAVYAKEQWDKWFPLSEYPVLTFQSAPAEYPVLPEHRHLQRHLVFSDAVQQEARSYIEENFSGEPFVGLHLRNGRDWHFACQPVGASVQDSYMSTWQCLEGTDMNVTMNMCLPTAEEVVRLTRQVIVSTGIRVLLVATDNDPMLGELDEGLRDYKVRIFHMNPKQPVVDLAMLSMSDHFIGNCVSSFTAFVSRTRSMCGKPTSYLGFS